MKTHFASHAARLFRLVAAVCTAPVRWAAPGLALGASISPTAQAAREFEIVSFQDLGTLGMDATFARDLNDQGWVVGEGYLNSGKQHAFFWQDGQMISLPGMYGAWGMNEQGHVVGDAEVRQYTSDFGILVTQRHAARYVNGTVTLLGSFDTDDQYSSSFGYAINGAGVIVGSADEGRNEIGDYDGTRAFRYAGGMSGISMPGVNSTGNGVAQGINEAGQIVGVAYDENSLARAFLRQPGGQFVELGTLGGHYSRANRINSRGDIVGSATTGAGNRQAFVRTPDGTMTMLPGVGFSIYSEALDINDAGWMVGEMRTQGGDVAFFHDGETLHNLNAMAAGYFASGNQAGMLDLRSATAINNQNQLVAYGEYRNAQGEDYWARSVLITLRELPPSLRIHDVGITGMAHGKVEGATVRLTLGSEVFATMTTDAEGRAELPEEIDQNEVYNIEIEKELPVPNQAAQVIRRTYAVIRPQDVLDEQVTLVLPVSLRAHLDTELKKLESPGTLILPYQANSIRSLMVDWNQAQPETASLHSERDGALARMLAASEGMAMVMSGVEPLSIDAATLVGKTLTGLMALSKLQGEMREQFEKQVGAQLSGSLISANRARIVFAFLLAGAEKATSKMAEAFGSALKTVVPGPGADLTQEALVVASKGIVTGLESAAWDKSKGLEGGREKLLKDLAEKVIGEVGGRVLASAHVAATQDDFQLAAIRTGNFSGTGAVLNSRNDALGAAIQVGEKINTAMDFSKTAVETADSFETVGDISKAVGSITNVRVFTIMAKAIAGINVGLVVASAGNDLHTLLEVSGEDTPEVANLAFFPSGGSGGGGEAAARPAAVLEWNGFAAASPATPERSPTEVSGPYASALSSLAAAIAGNDPLVLEAAADELLVEGELLDARVSDVAERLAILAGQNVPPPAELTTASVQLASARQALEAARAAFYPLVVGVLIPELADPETDLPEIQARIAALNTALGNLDTAVSAVASASSGMTAPASLVILSHGLKSGASGTSPGDTEVQALLLNAGDSPLTNLSVQFMPDAAGGPVPPLRRVSPATLEVASLAPGACHLLTWTAVATDVSADGSGSSATYQISATTAETPALVREGAIGIRARGTGFGDWIAGHLDVEEPRGFRDDPDGDGIHNGLERFFGRQPDQSDSAGLSIENGPAGTRLRHPRSNDRGYDTTPHYEWSVNLYDWLGSGTSSGGVSVTLDPVVVAGEGAEDQMLEIEPQVTGAPAGLFYRIRLEQDSPEPPSFPPPAAPLILTEPAASQSRNEGESFELEVTAQGTAPLLYQWKKDGVEIPFATGSTLRIENATSADAGNYLVEVSGLGGFIRSSVYQVDILSGGGD